MSSPPHPPWFNRPNDIQWRIQAVKFIIMQCYKRKLFIDNIGQYPLLTTQMSENGVRFQSQLIWTGAHIRYRFWHGFSKPILERCEMGKASPQLTLSCGAREQAPERKIMSKLKLVNSENYPQPSPVVWCICQYRHMCSMYMQVIRAS
jgi:hypothetical protein